MHLNIILLITLCFLSTLLTKILRVFCISSTRAAGLAHLNPTDLTAPIISGKIRSKNKHKENAEGIFLCQTSETTKAKTLSPRDTRFKQQF
jgi:hypothetical protein